VVALLVAVSITALALTLWIAAVVRSSAGVSEAGVSSFRRT
jgi:hypothetical protein